MQLKSGFILNVSIKQLIVFTFIAGFILYGNTLGNDYALDDAIIITKNEYTKQGLKGIPEILNNDSFTGFFGVQKKLVDGGRYRPLSIITFAIEYQFFGQSPTLSHLINILIYCLIIILFYLIIIQLLSDKLGIDMAKKLAFYAAMLFLIHPIHTEVVANIKGRDELLSLLFSLLSFITLLKFIDSGKKIHLLVLSGIYLFLGLMSKENSISFVAIVPLSFVLFKNIKIRQALIYSIPLVAASVLFLVIRYNILGGIQQNVSGELMNNPFLYAGLEQKYATIFYTWLIYFKLLVFPQPLTYDYYPYHIPIVDFSNPLVIVSLLVILTLLVLAIMGLKNKTVPAFSIIAFAASFSMVSNLFFPVGSFMNERFVFMPSLFWTLAVAYILIYLFHKEGRVVRIFILIFGAYFLVFFSVKTIVRNKAWKNDLTLFITDVKTSSESAKSNCSAGGKIWEQAKTALDNSKKNELFIQSEKYLRKSLEIHPDYADAWLLLGNVLFDGKKDIAGSAEAYIEVLKRQPSNSNAWQNIDIVLQQSDNKELQLSYYNNLYRIDSNKYIVNYRLGVLKGRYFNELEEAIYYLKRASQIDTTKVEALKDLGAAYGIMGMEREAYETCKKALVLDKNDPQIFINLGIASSILGLENESKIYFKEAELLKEKR